MSDIGNQWAILKSFEVRTDLIDVTSLADRQKSNIPSIGQVNFSGIAPATPEIIRVMSRWMYNDNPKFPIYAEEWMCLYCASPNELPERHCTQCGAPRNWLLG